MGTYYFPRFADVKLLRQFNFPLLYQFLSPYRDYLCDRHELRWTDDPDTFPFHRLAKILAASDDEMPDMLCSGLFFINALSEPKGTKRVIETLYQEGQLPSFPLSRNDCTLYGWLTAPGLVEELHTVEAADASREHWKCFRPCPNQCYDNHYCRYRRP